MEGQMVLLMDQPASGPSDAIIVDEPDHLVLDPAFFAAVDKIFMKGVKQSDIYGYLYDCFSHQRLPFKEEFLIEFSLRNNSRSTYIQEDIELVLKPKVGPYLFNFI